MSNDVPFQLQVSSSPSNVSLWLLLVTAGLILGMQFALGSKVDNLAAQVSKLEREVRLLQAYTTKLDATLSEQGVSVPVESSVSRE